MLHPCCKADHSPCTSVHWWYEVMYLFWFLAKAAKQWRVKRGVCCVQWRILTWVVLTGKNGGPWDCSTFWYREYRPFMRFWTICLKFDVCPQRWAKLLLLWCGDHYSTAGMLPSHHMRQEWLRTFPSWHSKTFKSLKNSWAANSVRYLIEELIILQILRLQSRHEWISHALNGYCLLSEVDSCDGIN